MPYLKQDLRNEIENQGELDQLCFYLSTLDSEYFPGALNYVIFRLVKAHLKPRRLSYLLLNNVIGALDCAKEEIRRRILNPYEDKKISENGDVE